MQTLLPLAVASLALHLAAALIVWRHVKRQRHQHHHAVLPVIGSDLHLTEALHQRIARRQPAADWLHPSVMRAKLSAWRRHSQAAESTARNA